MTESERNEFIENNADYFEEDLTIQRNTNSSFKISTINDLQKLSFLNYLCQQCKTFPIIDFVDKENINYRCCCENMKLQKKMKLEDYLKDLYSQGRSNEEEKCSCEGCEGKIEHYCFDCNKNLCDNCQVNHIKESKHKMNKIEEIKKEEKIDELFSYINKTIDNEINQKKDKSLKEQKKYGEPDMEESDMNSDQFKPSIILGSNENKGNKDEILPNYIQLIIIIIKEKNKNNYSYIQNIKNINNFLKKSKKKAFNTSKVTNMSGMFAGCAKLKKINLSSFDTRNVTNMSGMFAGCQDLEELNISSFNTEKVTNAEGAFSGCKNMEKFDLASFKQFSKETLTKSIY